MLVVRRGTAIVGVGGRDTDDVSSAIVLGQCGGQLVGSACVYTGER